MPGLNGYDVCRAIRASDDFRDTRIYAVSGLRGADHEHRCRDEGFSGQLTKPLDVTALAGLL
jgi:CheY-like chemotaxis protein